MMSTYATVLKDEELKECVTYLPSSVTNLSFDIIVDCGETYKYYNHPLCLYIVDGNNVIHVDITENITESLKYPNEIVSFIQTNYDLLVAFADMKIDGFDFYDNLTKINN